MCKFVRIFSLILITFFLIAWNSNAFEPPPERDTFSFAILGDRTGGKPDGLRFLHRAVFELNQIDPDFVIHIGDMVQGYTRNVDLWLTEYDEFISYIDKLKMPWYPTPGNHDVFSPIWDPEDRTFEELYKNYFGPLYYSFDYKNSHFIIMYTDEAMSSKPLISDTQLQWLKSDLEAAKKTNIFVFLHKPLWRYKDSNWEAVHQLLKDFPVRTVTAGHFHAYQKDMERDGIQYYLMGVTGGQISVSEHELTGWINHYNLIKVDGDKFTMAVVKLGNVESDDYILAKDYDNIWNISKISTEKTGTKGWLWQPIKSPIAGEIEIYAHNPMDTQLPLEIELNPYRGSWTMDPPFLTFILEPKSDVTAKVKISSSQEDPDNFLPPEIEFDYIYMDSRGDEVPVTVRNRVFLRDVYNVYKTGEFIRVDGLKNELFWNQTKAIYNHTWVYSVYERDDLPPKVYLATDGLNLYFFAEVMDDEYSYLKGNRPGRILSDTIIFSTMPAGERTELVIFPFNEEKNAFIGKVDSKGILLPENLTPISGVTYETVEDRQNGYYYCEGRIPLQTLFGDEPVAGKELPFNVGVIDNDREAFIYLYSWAYDRDPKYWGTLRFEE